MKYYITFVLFFIAVIVGYATEPMHLKEGNMISGHVIDYASEDNIPFASVLIVETGEGTSSNEQGQFEFRNLRPGKYTLRVSAMAIKHKAKVLT